MSLSKCSLRFVAFAATAVAILIVLGVLVARKGPSGTEKDKEFKELLSEWGIELPVSYEVRDNKQVSYRGEVRLSRYFRLELQKEQAESLLTNRRLNEALNWRQETSLPEARPRIRWWEAGTNTTHFVGSVSSRDKSQSIFFHVVIGANKAWIFVDSLSRRHEKIEKMEWGS